MGNLKILAEAGEVTFSSVQFSFMAICLGTRGGGSAPHFAANAALTRQRSILDLNVVLVQ
jgi:hypothetical protein